MIVIRTFFVLYCLLGIVGVSSSQSLFLSNYTNKDGLPQSSVHLMLQDSCGYLWIVTDRQICQYDGFSFKNHTKEYNLPSNRFRFLIELENGHIIAGTRKNGIFEYDGNKWNFYPINHSEGKLSVLCGVEYKRQLIIGTSQGLKILTNDSMISFMQDDIPKGVISELIVWGNKLIITSGNLVFEWNGMHSPRKLVTKCNPTGNLVKPYVSSDLTLWLLYDDCLGEVSESGDCVIHPIPEMLGANHTCDISEYERNVMLIATGSGLIVLYKNKWYIFKVGGVYSDDAFTPLSLCVDSEQNLWVGTLGGGLYKMNNRHMFHYDHKNGLSENIVIGFVEAEGRVWLNSQSKIFFIENNTVFLSRELSGSKLIFPVLGTDINHKLYYAYENCVFCYVNDRWEKCFFIEKDDESISNIIRLSFNDPSGELSFVYGDNTLYQLKESEFNQIEWLPDGYKNFYVDDVCVDNGCLWVALEKGQVLKRSDKEWSVHYSSEILEGKEIYSMMSDGDTLWVGTEGHGLYKFSETDMFHYTFENGLPDDTCYFIQKDNDSIVVGTNQGFFCLTPDGVNVYNSETGTVTMEFNKGASLKDSNDNIWMGTTNGILRLKPGYNMKKQVSIKTILKTVSFNGELVKISDNLQMKFNKNNLVVEFLGLYLTAPQNIHYRYWLEGLDSNWCVTEKRSVKFDRLSPGDYVFHISAAPGGMPFNNPESQFAFTIEKPFFNTVWFRMAVVVMCIIAGALIYHYGRKFIDYVFEMHQKRWFGKYRLLSVLGAGGMGTVYKARLKNTHNPIALKILHSNVFDNGNAQIFLNESTICESINNRNIVRIFDKGKYQGQYFIIMEYVCGKSLQQCIDNKKLSILESVAVTIALLRILKEIHHMGIVHRDLKPENIKIQHSFSFCVNTPFDKMVKFFEENIKLLDFGLARQFENDNTTESNLITGTPLFTPPECFLKQKCPEPAIDIYAVGIILYNMLSSQYPYRLDSSDNFKNLSVILYDNPFELREFAEVSETLNSIVMNMIKKDRKNRLVDINIICSKLFSLTTTVTGG